MDARKPKLLADLDELLDWPVCDGNSDGNTGLSVQPSSAQGSDGGTDLQSGQGEREYPSVRTKSREGPSGERVEDCGRTTPGECGDVSAGSCGNGAHSGEKPDGGILGIEGTVGAQLPDLPDGHWQAANYTIAPLAEVGVCNNSEVVDSPTTRLNRLVGKGLRKLEQILDLEPAPWDEDYIKILSMQKDAATNVVNLSIKADESRFRVQNETAIAVILDEVRRLKSAQTLVLVEA